MHHSTAANNNNFPERVKPFHRQKDITGITRSHKKTLKPADTQQFVAGLKPIDCSSGRDAAVATQGRSPVGAAKGGGLEVGWHYVSANRHKHQPQASTQESGNLRSNKHYLIVFHGCLNGMPWSETSSKNFLRQWIFQITLDRTLQWPRPIDRVKPSLNQFIQCCLIQLQ